MCAQADGTCCWAPVFGDGSSLNAKDFRDGSLAGVHELKDLWSFWLRFAGWTSHTWWEAATGTLDATRGPAPGITCLSSMVTPTSTLGSSCSDNNGRRGGIRSSSAGRCQIPRYRNLVCRWRPDLGHLKGITGPGLIQRVAMCCRDAWRDFL